MPTDRSIDRPAAANAARRLRGLGPGRKPGRWHQPFICRLCDANQSATAISR